AAAARRAPDSRLAARSIAGRYARAGHVPAAAAGERDLPRDRTAARRRHRHDHRTSRWRDRRDRGRQPGARWRRGRRARGQPDRAREPSRAPRAALRRLRAARYPGVAGTLRRAAALSGRAPGAAVVTDPATVLSVLVVDDEAPARERLGRLI